VAKFGNFAKTISENELEHKKIVILRVFFGHFWK